VATVLAVFVFAIITVKAVGEPMLGYDDRFQWAQKARIMLHEGTVWSPSFLDPLTIQMHPSYPLLIPSLEAALAVWGGGFNDHAIKVLFPWLFGAGLVLFATSLERLGVRSGSRVAALAAMLIPYFCGYGIARDNAAAFTAYPDLIMTVWLLGSVVMFVQADHERRLPALALSLVFAALACLTKAEGKLEVLVFIAIAAAWLAKIPTEARWWRCVAAAAALAALLIGAHEIVFSRSMSPGLDLDNYRMLLSPRQLLENRARWWSVSSVVAGRAFLSIRLGGVGCIAALAFLAVRRRTTQRAAFLAVLVAAGCAMAYIAPYLVAPDPWDPYFEWTGDRLLSHVVLVALWGTFAAILVVEPPTPKPGRNCWSGPDEA
jgi:hypothetical protein